MEKFSFKIDHYDEILDLLFPTEGIESNDFNSKMKENYKKMVEKAIYIAKCSPNDDKTFELLFKLKESVERIYPKLTDKIKDLQ